MAAAHKHTHKANVVPARTPAAVAAQPVSGSGRFRIAQAQALPPSCPCGGGCPRCREQGPTRSVRMAAAEYGVTGTGMPLPSGLRALLGAHLDADFSDVRLHTGSRAADAAARLQTPAYTLGRHVAFRHGFYAPHTGAGLGVLLHELTHVVQSRDAQENLSERDETAAVARLEREAERAPSAFGRAPFDVRERLDHRIPLCHPIYISAHGGSKYLDAAANFYASWGYSGTDIHKGVNSIEEVVKDLAGHGSIDHVTIVSHANPTLMRIRFVDGSPDQVLKSDWDVGTIADAVNLERHLAPSSMIDTVIQNVQNGNAAVLSKLGPVTDPFVRQFIWWTVDAVFAEYAGYKAGVALRMKAAAQSHAQVYATRLSNPPTPSPGGSAQAAVAEADLAAAEKAVRAQALAWQWGQNPPPDAGTQGEQETRVRESPSAEVVRLRDKPDFFQNVAKVRSAIGPDAWIEVQGCNAGTDRDYLKGMQRFFGGASSPKVSAPDWFQVFGHYGWSWVADSNKDAETRWKKPGVPEAFAYWFPVITGQKLPKVPKPSDLLNYLRQGHVLPLARPGATGSAHLLILAGKGERAFVEWLQKHQYRLTTVVDIKNTLFSRKAITDNMSATPIDWLEEHMSGPSKVILRPSPDYNRHIISV
jgi:hypothetical protein